MDVESAPAPAPAPAPATADIPPSQTLYLRNLNDKVKPDQLKKGLYELFTQFGSILDIVAMKRFALRGQAWVVFETVEAATNAMQRMQGFPFYDKPMVIQFAKTKSDAVAKRDGTFKPREKRARAAGDAKADAPAPPPAPAPAPAAGGAGAAVPQPDLSLPPNAKLFVQNLPAECTAPMLEALFKQYQGFKEVSIVEGRHIAFVEYENEQQAGVVLNATQNFAISPTHKLVVSFAA